MHLRDRMSLRAVVAVVALGAAVASPVVGTAALAPAYADPVPAAYSASTGGAAVSVGIDGLSTPAQTLLGVAGPVQATLARSATATDSTATVTTSADSVNLAAGAQGLAATSAARHAEQPAGPATDSGALASVSSAPVASTGALTGDVAANWAGAAACVPEGTPLTSSTTTMASADLGALTLSDLDPALPDLTVASLGAAQTHGETGLQASAGSNDVVSTETASIATTHLLNDLVQVDVAGPVTLTARSDGTTGSIAYSDPAVTLSADGSTTPVTTAGTTVSVPVAGLPAGLGELTATVTARTAPDPSGPTGATATASVPAVVSLEVDLSATGALATVLGSEVATTRLELLPLHADATAPTGGVECTLAPPVVSTPADGTATTDTTPLLRGTAEPGATVHVVVDGTPPADVTADPGGAWQLTPPDPLAYGEHDVVATQTLDGLTSAESNHPAFTVVPGPPTIRTPADETSTTDATPVLSGDAVPGATVHLVLDGGTPVDVTADPGGTWTRTPDAPLAPGGHRLRATQTAGGETSTSSGPTDFTILVKTAPATLGPPEVHSPADGSSTFDPTPPVTGSGEPGAEVTVSVDGSAVGTATVASDGSWQLEPGSPLDCSGHTVSATQSDGDRVSARSATHEFTVVCPDLPPAQPTLSEWLAAPSSAGTSSTASSGTLADTGAPRDLGWLALLGLLGLAGGVLLVRQSVPVADRSPRRRGRRST